MTPAAPLFSALAEFVPAAEIEAVETGDEVYVVIPGNERLEWHLEVIAEVGFPLSFGVMTVTVSIRVKMEYVAHLAGYLAGEMSLGRIEFPDARRGLVLVSAEGERFCYFAGELISEGTVAELMAGLG